MCGTTETRTQLPLSSAAQHGCSCCSPTHATQDTARLDANAESPTAATGAEYALEGLTCGHCVLTVEKAVAGVSGVETAAVRLVAGGTSRLTITGSAQQEALAEAVRAAGYALAGAAR